MKSNWILKKISDIALFNPKKIIPKIAKNVLTVHCICNIIYLQINKE